MKVVFDNCCMKLPMNHNQPSLPSEFSLYIQIYYLKKNLLIFAKHGRYKTGKWLEFYGCQRKEMKENVTRYKHRIDKIHLLWVLWMQSKMSFQVLTAIPEIKIYLISKKPFTKIFSKLSSSRFNSMSFDSKGCVL